MIKKPRNLVGSHVLIGPPGTGKTRYLSSRVAEIASETPPAGDRSPVLITSLTRAAAAEIASRVSAIPREAVATLHAHGWRSQGSPPVVDAEMMAEWNRTHPQFALSLRDGDGGDGMDLMGGRRGTVEAPGDSIAEHLDMARHRCEPWNSLPDYVVDFAEKWQAWKDSMGAVDFTDMIERAGPIPPLGAGIIIADEAQDCSTLEWRLLDAWSAGGALIAVGDPRQALYTWRGADPTRLSERREGRHGVLRRSYRVPRAVLDAAQAWATELSDYEPVDYGPRLDEAGVEAPGNVGDCGATWGNSGEAVHEAVELAESGQTVMLAVSANYMASPIVAELKSRGVPFSNPWRTKNGLWNPLSKRNGTTQGERIAALLRPTWTWAEAWKWIEPMSADYGGLRRGSKATIEAMATERPDEPADVSPLFQAGALLPIKFNAANGNNDKAISWWLEKLLAPHRRVAEYAAKVASSKGLGALMDQPKIYVGTIHSFKGGEADNVFLFPDISRAAAREWFGGGPGRDDVVRTYYVGITRAKNRLKICQQSSRLGVKEELLQCVTA